MTMMYEAQKKRTDDRALVSHKMHYPPVDEIFGSLSNHELSGVQNWFDLEDRDCEEQYKNKFETAAGFSITKESIVELYRN